MSNVAQSNVYMKEDKQGFLYPFIVTTSCIDCGFCEKVCPILNAGTTKEPLQVFAAKNKDENQRLRSSSGGTFITGKTYYQARRCNIRSKIRYQLGS